MWAEKNLSSCFLRVWLLPLFFPLTTQGKFHIISKDSHINKGGTVASLFTKETKVSNHRPYVPLNSLTFGAAASNNGSLSEWMNQGSSLLMQMIKTSKLAGVKEDDKSSQLVSISDGNSTFANSFEIGNGEGNDTDIANDTNINFEKVFKKSEVKKNYNNNDPNSLIQQNINDMNASSNSPQQIDDVGDFTDSEYQSIKTVQHSLANDASPFVSVLEDSYHVKEQIPKPFTSDQLKENKSRDKLHLGASIEGSNFHFLDGIRSEAQKDIDYTKREDGASNDVFSALRLQENNEDMFWSAMQTLNTTHRFIEDNSKVDLAVLEKTQTVKPGSNSDIIWIFTTDGHNVRPPLVTAPSITINSLTTNYPTPHMDDKTTKKVTESVRETTPRDIMSNLYPTKSPLKGAITTKSYYKNPENIESTENDILQDSTFLNTDSTTWTTTLENVIEDNVDPIRDINAINNNRDFGSSLGHSPDLFVDPIYHPTLLTWITTILNELPTESYNEDTQGTTTRTQNANYSNTTNTYENLVTSSLDAVDKVTNDETTTAASHDVFSYELSYNEDSKEFPTTTESYDSFNEVVREEDDPEMFPLTVTENYKLSTFFSVDLDLNSNVESSKYIANKINNFDFKFNTSNKINYHVPEITSVLSNPNINKLQESNYNKFNYLNANAEEPLKFNYDKFGNTVNPLASYNDFTEYSPISNTHRNTGIDSSDKTYSTSNKKTSSFQNEHSAPVVQLHIWNYVNGQLQQTTAEPVSAVSPDKVINRPEIPSVQKQETPNKNPVSTLNEFHKGNLQENQSLKKVPQKSAIGSNTYPSFHFGNPSMYDTPISSPVRDEVTTFQSLDLDILSYIDSQVENAAELNYDPQNLYEFVMNQDIESSKNEVNQQVFTTDNESIAQIFGSNENPTHKNVTMEIQHHIPLTQPVSDVETTTTDDVTDDQFTVKEPLKDVTTVEILPTTEHEVTTPIAHINAVTIPKKEDIEVTNYKLNHLNSPPVIWQIYQENNNINSNSITNHHNTHQTIMINNPPSIKLPFEILQEQNLNKLPLNSAPNITYSSFLNISVAESQQTKISSNSQPTVSPQNVNNGVGNVKNNYHVEESANVLRPYQDHFQQGSTSYFLPQSEERNITVENIDKFVNSEKQQQHNRNPWKVDSATLVKEYVKRVSFISKQFKKADIKTPEVASMIENLALQSLLSYLLGKEDEIKTNSSYNPLKNIDEKEITAIASELFYETTQKTISSPDKYINYSSHSINKTDHISISDFSKLIIDSVFKNESQFTTKKPIDKPSSISPYPPLTNNKLYPNTKKQPNNNLRPTYPHQENINTGLSEYLVSIMHTQIKNTPSKAEITEPQLPPNALPVHSQSFDKPTLPNSVIVDIQNNFPHNKQHGVFTTNTQKISSTSAFSGVLPNPDGSVINVKVTKPNNSLKNDKPNDSSLLPVKSDISTTSVAVPKPVEPPSITDSIMNSVTSFTSMISNLVPSGATFQECLHNVACTFALASSVAIGATSVMTLPFVVPLGRRKRSTPEEESRIFLLNNNLAGDRTPRDRVFQEFQRIITFLAEHEGEKTDKGLRVRKDDVIKYLQEEFKKIQNSKTNN